MTPDFEKGLTQHFEKVDQLTKDRVAAGRAAQDKETELHSRFNKIVKEVVEPLFGKIRDLLLSRNNPAAIIRKTKDDLSTGELSYVALHSSTEISHMNLIDRDPMNVISYTLLKNAGVIFKATRLDKKEELTLEEMTSEKVEAQLMKAVQECFNR